MNPVKLQMSIHSIIWRVSIHPDSLRVNIQSGIFHNLPLCRLPPCIPGQNALQ